MVKNRKKDNGRLVAIVIPTLGGGGAERVAVNLANGFIGRGYAVDMILQSASGEFLADLHPDIRVVDLQARRLRLMLLGLVSYFRREKPSAALVFMWPLTVMTLWARTLSRVPVRVVVTEHFTWSRDVITQSLWGLFKVSATMHYTFKSAEAIVAVSKGVADDLARLANLDRNLISTIYNPLATARDAFSSSPGGAESWWGGTHKRVIAVGSLKPPKDYETLLHSFALLQKNIDARLLILGEGGCRPALEMLTRQLGIEDSVYMPGFVKDPYPYFQRADLHVLSSTGEGFGNVIVEALEAGTPVVSTDCPSGPREILADGRFGRLVPVGDVAALADAMAESLTSLHDSSALKVRAQDFSIESAVDQYLNLLLPDRDRSRLVEQRQ